MTKHADLAPAVTWRAWGRLLRLSLLPSPAADVVAGLVVAHAGSWPSDARAWWLVPASLGVYHGALALNDWNDREHDARTRAARPIPSGAVSPRAALVAGTALIALGLACAALASTASLCWMIVVAMCAIVYDVAGRGPWIGPILLAACRAGNLGSGIWWTLSREHRLEHDVAVFVPCILYGAYVFFVSRLGRMEDSEDGAELGDRPRALLVSAAALLVAPAALAEHTIGRVLAIAVGGAGAFGLARAALSTRTWTRPLVERSMGLALRRLLVFDAALVLAFQSGTGSWVPVFAAAAILAGYALAHALRALFPPS